MVNNYCVVCLTYVVIEVYESITRAKCLYDNNLLLPNQHGFITRRSCCTHAFNDWTLSLDKHLSTDAVHSDFSKAFDSVPHTILLLKFQAYGITGKLLVWLKSFLMGRHQCVKVNGTLSSWKWGCRVYHKDLFLGHCFLLCIIKLYVNKLPPLVSSKLLMFADYIKL